MRNIIEQFANKTVLVLGDIMLDKYNWGEVSRVSPEAPVPVVHNKKETFVLGGAGNTASNVAALGAKTILIGIVGNDNGRTIVEKLLNEQKIQHELIVLTTHPTIQKIRIMAQGMQLLRLDHEREFPEMNERISSAIQQYASAVDIIIISDYAKGTITREIVQKAIATGKKVCIDPKPAHWQYYTGAHLLKPNLVEAQELVKKKCLTEQEVTAAGLLLSTNEHANIVLSRGKDGMSVFTTEGKVTHLPTQGKEVYDVTGAGDTVLATLALAIASGADITEAAMLANHAAGVKVGKIGTATVSAVELISAIEFGEKKIKSREDLNRIVADYKQKCKRIVFTNGCFDILHVGHARLLAEAKKFGDVLIVGLNSDESVRKLKGPSRPIIGELDRAEVLASLSAVDYVTIFPEDTPLALLELLQPHVHVKGGDYTKEKLPETPTVEKYGGEIKIIPLAEGRSTTNIIERSKK